MRRLAAIAVTLGLLSGVSEAEPVRDPIPEHRSRVVALALSLGGAVLSAAVFAGGYAEGNSGAVTLGVLSMVIAPSFGEVYADHPATIGTGIRTAGAAVLLLGLLQSTPSDIDKSSGIRSQTSGGAALIGGAIIVGAGTLYDIVDAPRQVDRFNLRVTPAMVPTATGMAPAVGIGGSF